jgi:hypothetical protein
VQLSRERILVDTVGAAAPKSRVRSTNASRIATLERTVLELQSQMLQQDKEFYALVLAAEELEKDRREYRRGVPDEVVAKIKLDNFNIGLDAISGLGRIPDSSQMEK